MLLFCRCLVGAVFLVAAIGKLRGYRAFRESLRAMRIPPWIAGPVVAAEFAVPGLLVVEVRAGFVLAALLLAAFTLAIRLAAPAACHCFGTVSPLGRRHLVRNAVLAAAAVTGVVVAGSPMTVPAIILGGPLGLLGAVIVVRLDDLVALFTPAPPFRPAPLFRPATGNARAARPAGNRTRPSTSPPH